MRSLTRAKLSGKTALVRLDLDLTQEELKNLAHPRLTRALKTLRFLISKKVRALIIIAHRSRPKKITPSLSLKPYVEIFSEALGIKVGFCPSLKKADVKKVLADSEIVLLENLRFCKGEEKNDPDFAKDLASLAQIYIFDAFGSAHREHASVVGIPKYLPSYPGGNFQKELEVLGRVKSNPEHPFVAIIGGAKLETKLPIINKMLSLADYVLVGGELIEEKLPLSPKLVLPEDVWVAEKVETAYQNESVEIFKREENREIDKRAILDIGPVTIKKYQNFVSIAKLVVWVGPLGMFEDSRFASGSREIARAISSSSGFSVVGGGETLSIVVQLNLVEKIDHLSLGGGAMLSFLVENTLPAVLALESNS